MTGQRNEICVIQGEPFSIDKCIINEDGSPFIVSNALANPYFVITIAQSKYSQKNRYIKKYWLKIDKNDTFYCTNAIKLDNLNSAPTVDIPDGVAPEAYAIYYIETDNAKSYYRWTSTGYEPYETRIICSFSTDDTLYMTEQSYVYSIELVDGEDTELFVTNLYSSITDAPSDSFEEMYTVIKNHNAELLQNVDIDKPLVNSFLVAVILAPTAFVIVENIDGGAM